jgi:hypothetical protein
MTDFSAIHLAFFCLGVRFRQCLRITPFVDEAEINDSQKLHLFLSWLRTAHSSLPEVMRDRGFQAFNRQLDGWVEREFLPRRRWANAQVRSLTIAINARIEEMTQTDISPEWTDATSWLQLGIELASGESAGGNPPAEYPSTFRDGESKYWQYAKVAGVAVLLARLGVDSDFFDVPELDINFATSRTELWDEGNTSDQILGWISLESILRRGPIVPQALPRPRWDEEHRTLFVGDQVARTYQKNKAENQAAVLREFEKYDWKQGIEIDRFTGQVRRVTVNALNKRTKLIQFFSENETIHWRLVNSGQQ